MKYLSIDIESTGLDKDCQIIQFALVAFDAEKKEISEAIKKEYLIKCPSLEELKNQVNPWVYTNMGDVINLAHQKGIPLGQFKNELISYLKSAEVQNYFNHEKIVLFGKSLSAIDIPFLKRDLGWDTFSDVFMHRNLDLSCFCYSLIDLGLLTPEMGSGEKLMKFFNMGDVCHTAMDDAINTIKLYFNLLDMCKERLQPLT
ncbi:hypothetical protein N9N67_11580 [Bacteriovoracaceae bacterium]|nr:hypothetical protein [Bacteriovoracaceae bacterium]